MPTAAPWLRGSPPRCRRRSCARVEGARRLEHRQTQLDREGVNPVPGEPGDSTAGYGVQHRCVAGRDDREAWDLVVVDPVQLEQYSLVLQTRLEARGPVGESRDVAASLGIE